MKTKKIISYLLCILMTCVFISHPVYAQENEVVYDTIEVDGIIYNTETKVNNDSTIIKTNILLDNKLINEIVVDMNTGIITDNGNKIGFIEEIHEKQPIPAIRESALIDSISPNSISPGGGGGGTKKYVTSYKVGINGTTRAVVYTAVFGIVTGALTAISAKLGIATNPKAAKLIPVLGTFITKVVTDKIPGTKYVKAFDTGTVYSSRGAKYRRALLEFYGDSSYSKYEGCEWGDAPMR